MKNTACSTRLALAGVSFFIAGMLLSTLLFYVAYKQEIFHLLTPTQYEEHCNLSDLVDYYKLKQNLRQTLPIYARSVVNDPSISGEQRQLYQKHYLPDVDRFVQLGDLESLRFANRNEVEIREGSFVRMDAGRKELRKYYETKERCLKGEKSPECVALSSQNPDNMVFVTADAIDYYPCYYGRDCEKYSSLRPYIGSDMEWHINVGGKVYNLVFNGADEQSKQKSTPLWQVTDKTVPMTPPSFD